MTDLQTVYDRFYSKSDYNYEGLEGLVFEFLNTSIIYVKRDLVLNFSYTLTNALEYEGHFDEDITEEAIEYLALWMIWCEASRERARITKKKTEIGTKDFNRKETNKSLMESKIQAQEQAYLDIVRYRDGFYYM